MYTKLKEKSIDSKNLYRICDVHVFFPTNQHLSNIAVSAHIQTNLWLYPLAFKIIQKIALIWPEFVKTFFPDAYYYFYKKMIFNTWTLYNPCYCFLLRNYFTHCSVSIMSFPFLQNSLQWLTFKTWKSW